MLTCWGGGQKAVLVTIRSSKSPCFYLSGAPGGDTAPSIPHLRHDRIWTRHCTTGDLRSCSLLTTPSRASAWRCSRGTFSSIHWEFECKREEIWTHNLHNTSVGHYLPDLRRHWGATGFLKFSPRTSWVFCTTRSTPAFTQSTGVYLVGQNTQLVYGPCRTGFMTLNLNKARL